MGVGWNVRTMEAQGIYVEYHVTKLPKYVRVKNSQVCEAKIRDADSSILFDLQQHVSRSYGSHSNANGHFRLPEVATVQRAGS